MSLSRRLATIALLAAAPLTLAACTDSTPTTTTQTSAATPSPTAALSEEMDTGAAGTFTMTTADGLSITGTAGRCENPVESTLSVTFSGDGSQVAVDAAGGIGTVSVSGAVEFEGAVEFVEVGDAGNVTATGRGSLADPGAQPTTFEITGSCP